MKVTVTSEHIEKSRASKKSLGDWRGICSTCPLALALQEVTKIHTAWTNGDEWGLYMTSPEGAENPARLPLPDGARMWISQYDTWEVAEQHWELHGEINHHNRPMTPATFEL
jgi:hypothetical protein